MNKSFGSHYLEKTELLGKETAQKDTKDGDVTDRKRISREAFISQCLSQLESNSPSSGILGKIIQGDQLLSPKESARQPSARSPRLAETGKYDLNTSDYMKNFLQKYSSSTNQRSQESFSPRINLTEFIKAPKISARENILTESSILSSKLSPRQILQDSSRLSRSPKIASSRQWPLETGSEQLKGLKTISDMHHSKYQTFSYLKKDVKREKP